MVAENSLQSDVVSQKREVWPFGSAQEFESAIQ